MITKVNSFSMPSSSLYWFMLRYGVSHGDILSFPTLSQKWREMFESFDYNQDGIIDAGELASALNHYGCALFQLKWLHSQSECSYLTIDCELAPP